MTTNQLAASLSAARQAVRQGDRDAAARHYKAAVKLDRNNAALLLETGVNSAQSGNMKLARKFLLQAQKLSPGNPDIYFNLGHIALLEPDYPASKRAFERVEELDPEFPELSFSLASALFGLNSYSDALLHAEAAVAEAQQDVDALFLKAQCEERLSLDDQAMQTLQTVNSINPSHLDARLLLAGFYSKRFLAARVAEQLEPVFRSPNLPLEALARLTDLYGVCGLSEKAGAIAQRALDLAPQTALANTLFASAQIDLGDFDLAEKHFRAALQIDPSNPLPYQGLADVKRLTENDRKPLEQVFHSSKSSEQHRMQCGFALYYLNNKAKRYDEAFAALVTSNMIMKREDSSDVEQSQAGLLKLRDILNRDLLAARQGQGFDAPGAIFIVGMPRSGTTLAEQILAGHPSVLAGGERTDITEQRRTIPGFPEGIKDLDETWAHEAGRKVSQAMFAATDEQTYATDKLPGNYAFVGFIKWILPQAKFIYCHRRPEANALSLFEQHFNTLPFSRDLKNIATVYNAHNKIIDHWRNECGIDMFDLDYDALVQDPEPIAKQLYEHVGLDWKTEYLDITKVKRSVSTASRWQARQPINTTSVERWRRYEKHLAPFIDALERH